MHTSTLSLTDSNNSSRPRVSWSNQSVDKEDNKQSRVELGSENKTKIGGRIKNDTISRIKGVTKIVIKKGTKIKIERKGNYIIMASRVDPLGLLESYLSDRIQRVDINGERSSDLQSIWACRRVQFLTISISSIYK
ncbi:hypothetical protein EVAR_27497_1 [Eumeta japonica]|uniref:Uncharacterized protein n=1 Tax=Eumeta variegata TaxID=151549 RepID=A0A4C1XEU4_EUMVA|nr:hypothetical protein EVAR_27497_1 [Eumeta japonica]